MRTGALRSNSDRKLQTRCSTRISPSGTIERANHKVAVGSKQQGSYRQQHTTLVLQQPLRVVTLPLLCVLTGNSGGPALRDDVVVGVAFQNVPNADNIGYIIPLPVVRRFMR